MIKITIRNNRKRLNSSNKRENSRGNIYYNGAFDEDVQVGYRNQKVERISDNIIDDLYYGNTFFKRIVDELT